MLCRRHVPAARLRRANIYRPLRRERTTEEKSRGRRRSSRRRPHPAPQLRRAISYRFLRPLRRERTTEKRSRERRRTIRRRRTPRSSCTSHSARCTSPATNYRDRRSPTTPTNHRKHHSPTTPSTVATPPPRLTAWGGRTPTPAESTFGTSRRSMSCRPTTSAMRRHRPMGASRRGVA